MYILCAAAHSSPHLDLQGLAGRDLLVQDPAQSYHGRFIPRRRAPAPAPAACAPFVPGWARVLLDEGVAVFALLPSEAARLLLLALLPLAFRIIASAPRAILSDAEEGAAAASAADWDLALCSLFVLASLLTGVAHAPPDASAGLSDLAASALRRRD